MLSDRLYFRDLADFLGRGRKPILAAAAAGFLAAVAAILLAEPAYVARTTLTPTEYNKYGAPQAIQSVGLSVRSLIGLDRIGESGNQVAQFKELLASTVVAERLQQRHAILQRLFPDRWNAATASWEPPGGARAALSRLVRSLAGLPGWRPPDAIAAKDYIAARLTIEERRGSDLFAASFRHRDPEFAAFMLRALWAEADGFLRERARERADAHIAYIQEKLQAVGNRETRAALIQLLVSEEGNAMLINAGVPYAVEVLEPPLPPASPVSPRPLLWLAVGLFGGLAAGVLLWAALDGLDRRAERPAHPD